MAEELRQEPERSHPGRELLGQVVQIAEHRQADSAAAWERGEAFAFRDYIFNEDGFGLVENGDVVIVLDHEALTGIRMSKMDAMRFASAVLETALADVDG